MRYVQSQLFETGAPLSPTNLNRSILDVQRALADAVGRRYVRSSSQFQLGAIANTDNAAYLKVGLQPPYTLHLDVVRVYFNLAAFTGTFELTVTATNIDGWRDLVLTEDDVTVGEDGIAVIDLDMRIPANNSVTISVSCSATTWSFDYFDIELGVVCDRHQGDEPDVDTFFNRLQKSGVTVPTDISAVSTSRSSAKNDNESEANTRLIRMYVLDFGRDFTPSAANNVLRIWPSLRKAIEVHRASFHCYTTTALCTVLLLDEAGSTKLTFTQAVNADLVGQVGNIATGQETIDVADEDDANEAWTAKMSLPIGTLVERAYLILYVGE